MSITDDHPDVVTQVCARLSSRSTETVDAVDVHDDATRIAASLLPLASSREHDDVARAAVARMHGLGPLAVFLDDPSVNEIIVNNGREVWIERDGTTTRCGTLDSDDAPRLIERILSPLGRRLDRLSPIVDARLADGSRLCAVIPPVAVDGPCFTVRRFGVEGRSLLDFATAAVVALLGEIVDRRCNVLISGATSSGKTSLMNALASRIQPGDRIITLEDTAELRLEAAHVLRLETRPATVDGVPAVTMTDLVRASLRLRPDRIIVGEVRGGEVVDMLQALNTGHDGSLATIHANGPRDAVRRLGGLLAQHAPSWSTQLVDEYVRSSIDVVIHVERDGAGGRRVREVVELAPPGADVDRVLIARGEAIDTVRRTRA